MKERDNNEEKQRLQALIFGSLFMLANKLQVVSDQYLEKDGITTKQWLLLAAISFFKETAPTLSEVSQMIGSSRQNTKQLALKLEKNGFLKILRDEQDTRAYRLTLTAKCDEYWKSRENQDQEYISDLFGLLSFEETAVLAGCIPKLLKKIEEANQN
ncbi:MAG: MarR family transcriptional regulator [Clostridiales bacterium]|nr:MarR family transcriptional regulator [Clostridiales bacterium]